MSDKINYDKMSDFEINKEVSSLVDFGEIVVTVNDSNETVYLCEKDGLWDVLPISHFDPCNNPSDAWPVIIGNKITIIHNAYDDMHMACSSYEHSWCHEAGDRIWFDNETVSNNPLRAAMICFLKMKGE